MDLNLYVENLQRQLAVAADAGGEEAHALGERLLGPLDAAVRLTLLEALGAAAEEITCDLAPGSVEVRLRGRDPEFVVTSPPGDASLDGRVPDDDADVPRSRPIGAPGPAEPQDGAMSRINLRMPDQLKARIERAAAAESLSVNAWLVRAAAAALERADPEPRRAPRGPQRFTGWAR